MLKTIFLFIFLSLLVKVFPLNVSDIEEEEKPNSLNAETTFSSHYLNSLDHKIDTLAKTLSTVDTSIKQLQERAHTWAIFHHHIDSWNDQMKTIEHKIDLIRRTQDENQIVSQKLISQEFVLNHILSKLVYLSDSCNHGENVKNLDRNGENSENDLSEIKKLINSDRKMRNEIGTRLSNILRHVQNMEKDSCKSCTNTKSNINRNNNETKMAKLIHPIMTCNSSKTNNGHIEMRDIDQKLKKLVESVSQGELKKIIENHNENTERWNEIKTYIDRFDSRIMQMKDLNAENYVHFANMSQSMSNEISTFTESSDLLLKKFEKQIMDIHKNVDKLGKREECDKKISPSGTEPETAEKGDSGEKFDINVQSSNKDVEEIDNGSRDYDESVEEIDFVQTSKTGCHELKKRVDGIYKFSTPKLNEAGRDMNQRYCIFKNDGPAWTVIQNRGAYDLQENFNRSWDEYRFGFGSLEKDFWWGNEFLHQLTYFENYELRIELEDFEDNSAWVEYSTFRISAEESNFNLIVDGYSGSIPDGLGYHNMQDFSSYDRRNDKTVDACCACATGYGSGWWFNNCAEVNLNGMFQISPLGNNFRGIVWEPWHGDYSLRSSKMMLRPKVWSTEKSSNDSSEDP